MKHIPLFSLVIFPNSEQSNLIKSYKQLLKNHIGCSEVLMQLLILQ